MWLNVWSAQAKALYIWLNQFHNRRWHMAIFYFNANPLNIKVKQGRASSYIKYFLWLHWCADTSNSLCNLTICWLCSSNNYHEGLASLLASHPCLSPLQSAQKACRACDKRQTKEHSFSSKACHVMSSFFIFFCNILPYSLLASI